MTGREIRLGSGCVLAVVLAHLVDLSGWTRPHLGTDVLHVFAFAAIGFLVVRTLRARGMTGPIAAPLLTLAASFLLGLLGEAAQVATARDADWQDIVRDLLGAGAGIAIATAFGSKRASLRALFGATAALLITIGALPTIAEALAWWSADRHFPVVDDFENRVQRRLWRSTG
ncbi:MAG: VanZ family protein, partial [Myxococcales bacterium]|nr:VanZ family protein [Myxococcales bacterium]